MRRMMILTSLLFEGGETGLKGKCNRDVEF